MTHYPIQPRDQIFLKCYGFLYITKNMGRISIKIKVKTSAVNTVRNVLLMVNNLQQMHLKLLQKEQFKKHEKQLVI